VPCAAGFAPIGPFALLPQLLHIHSRPAFQFRVIFCLPGGSITLKKAQELAALHFLPCRLEKESATPARTDQIVDLPQQIAGNKDVCSLCACHVCI
jgi:hypothetical protein